MFAGPGEAFDVGQPASDPFCAGAILMANANNQEQAELRQPINYSRKHLVSVKESRWVLAGMCEQEPQKINESTRGGETSYGERETVDYSTRRYSIPDLISKLNPQFPLSLPLHLIYGRVRIQYQLCTH